MNQFLVPQFIEVEPKIIFGVNIRQFLIVVVGIVAAVLCFKLADLSLFIVEAIIIAILVILIGFVPINGRSFPMFFLDLLHFGINTNVRVWKREDLMQFAVQGVTNDKKILVAEKEPIKRSKLSELSLLLDTAGAYKVSENLNNSDTVEDIDLG